MNTSVGNMIYDLAKHRRRSIRLRGYDYHQPGAYFVTICTQNRECIFGEVVDRQMILNEAGRMVETVWRELPQHYAGIEVEAFVVMPNHVHGIIILVGAGAPACPDNPGRPQGVAPTMSTMSLPDVVHRFKSLTTARYRHGVRQDGWRPFPGRLWQRNYYERVIRGEKELNRVREYIINNPLHWEQDPENPLVVRAGPGARPGSGALLGGHRGSPLRDPFS